MVFYDRDMNKIVWIFFVFDRLRISFSIVKFERKKKKKNVKRLVIIIFFFNGRPVHTITRVIVCTGGRAKKAKVPTS